MSYPIWPSGLDSIERDSYQAQPQDARRKRGFENGPPGYRRRFSAVARMVSMSLVTGAEGRARFHGFHDDDCAQGASLFWMPDPTRNGWPLLASDGTPLLAVAGQPLLVAAQWLCAWGDQPPVETMTEQVKFRISFNVVVMP